MRQEPILLSLSLTRTAIRVLDFLRPFIVMRVKNKLLRPISNAEVDLVLCVIHFFNHCIDKPAVVEDLFCTVMQMSG
jgi:hypothetical protein